MCIRDSLQATRHRRRGPLAPRRDLPAHHAAKRGGVLVCPGRGHPRQRLPVGGSWSAPWTLARTLCACVKSPSEAPVDPTRSIGLHALARSGARLARGSARGNSGVFARLVAALQRPQPFGALSPRLHLARGGWHQYLFGEQLAATGGGFAVAWVSGMKVVVQKIASALGASQ